MIKRIFAVLIIFMIVGCQEKINSYKTIFDLTFHFKNKGFNVSDYKEIGSSFGESEAWELEINGQTVDILKYNTDVPSQAKILRNIKWRGKMIDTDMTVVANGSFVLWMRDLQNHKDIIDA